MTQTTSDRSVGYADGLSLTTIHFEGNNDKGTADRYVNVIRTELPDGRILSSRAMGMGPKGGLKYTSADSEENIGGWEITFQRPALVPARHRFLTAANPDSPEAKMSPAEVEKKWDKSFYRMALIVRGLDATGVRGLLELAASDWKKGASVKEIAENLAELVKSKGQTAFISR